MPVADGIEVRQLAMEIYGGCNYRCRMCPQADGREPDFLARLPFDVFEKVVDDAMAYGLEVVSLHGSGEPTVHPEMPRFVEAVKRRGLTCIALTNGFRLTPTTSRALLDAGLDLLRVSVIGSDAASYARWMGRDAYDRVHENVRAFLGIRDALGSSTEVRLYHLVTDPTNTEREVAAYREDWIEALGCPGEIWMMHNWSGTFVDVPYPRRREHRRGCGRPHAPQLTVRAGGAEGRHAAVVPCCFVLGRDSDAILGHLDHQTIAEVVAGPAYGELRGHHERGEFDAVDYCRGCDQLYDAPETLVWSNVPGKRYGQSKFLADLDFRAYSDVGDPTE